MARRPTTTQQAISRLIPRGGAKTEARIREQLRYITRKGRLQLFGPNRYQGEELGPQNFREIARNFATGTGLYISGQSAAESTKDLTAHLVVSFPSGTPNDAALKAAKRWAEAVFSSDQYGGPFEYVGALHTDTDNPHAHFIVSRRSLGQDGAWLRISETPRDQRLGTIMYRSLREELVSAGRAFGIDLEDGLFTSDNVLPTRSINLLDDTSRGDHDDTAPRTSGLSRLTTPSEATGGPASLGVTDQEAAASSTPASSGRAPKRRAPSDDPEAAPPPERRPRKRQRVLPPELEAVPRPVLPADSSLLSPVDTEMPDTGVPVAGQLGDRAQEAPVLNDAPVPEPPRQLTLQLEAPANATPAGPAEPSGASPAAHDAAAHGDEALGAENEVAAGRARRRRTPANRPLMNTHPMQTRLKDENAALRLRSGRVVKKPTGQTRAGRGR